MIPEEETLLESNAGVFLLTSHKVRFNSVSGGSGSVVSIMLEHVSGCEIVKRTKPVFLVLAAVFFAAGTLASIQDGGLVPILIGFAFAVVFVVAYYRTRSQVLAVSSPSARMAIDTAGMALDAVLDAIGQIEAAKDRRLTALKKS